MIASCGNDRARANLALADLHALRSQDELERAVAAQIASLAAGATAALCLAEAAGGTMQVRQLVGADNPLRGRTLVQAGDWPWPAAPRLPIRCRSQTLGELWLDREVSPAAHESLTELLVHFGTALVNLTLQAESRQATEDYCASLQALEEGIVLFQEEDPAAVTARLLSLATSMVQANAGALYVLREVGVASSGLRLEQALGIPESLLAGFRGQDGCAWPDVLLEQPAQLAVRPASGAAVAGAPMAMLAPECVPPMLESVVVLPLRYHGVQAGVCLLFNPQLDATRPRDFLGRLQSFGQLAAAVLHRLSLEAITAESRSIARELEIAETIQKRLVLSSAPPTEEYDFAWSTIAAKNIGGDYVDVIGSEPGDIYVVVADASGHGINSALLMTSFRANCRGNAPRNAPEATAATLNREVWKEVGPTGMFITAVLLRLERTSRRLYLCSAGHNPTLIWRAATGSLEVLAAQGPPMGFLADSVYESCTAQLASGDVILLYTDGVTEATNEDLDMFGEERLQALLQEHADAPPAQLVQAVSAALAAFTGRDRHDDDVSLVVVKVR